MNTRRSIITHHAGFTLIEVMAGMALIVMLIGSVYGVADGTLRLSTSLSNARTAEARVNHFTTVWRSSLENLGPTAKIFASTNSDGRELSIEGARGIFAWSRVVRTAAAVRLVFALSDHCLVVKHLKSSSNGELQTIGELTLLDGVRELSWQFYDAQSKAWSDDWTSTERLPTLMRLRCVLTDQPFPLEGTFWISGGAAKVAQTSTPVNQR